jgi:hypothetical protein
LVWKEKGKHAREQSFNLGYIHHRLVQHNISLITKTIYRYNFNGSFNNASGLPTLLKQHSVKFIDRMLSSFVDGTIGHGSQIDGDKNVNILLRKIIEVTACSYSTTTMPIRNFTLKHRVI